jgi:hypothetical protein
MTGECFRPGGPQHRAVPRKNSSGAKTALYINGI